MKYIIPYYRHLFPQNGPLAQDGDVAAFLPRLLESAPPDADALVVVSDMADALDMATRLGCGVLKHVPADGPQAPLLPRGGGEALRAMVAAGRLAVDEPAAVIDCCGCAMSAAVRRAARERFARGDATALVHVAMPEDHPVQVRAYPMQQPLGLACFDLTETVLSPGCVLSCRGAMAASPDEPRLVWHQDAPSLLLLARPPHPQDEFLAIFAVGADRLLRPVAYEPATATSKFEAGGCAAATFSLAPDTAAVAVLHMAAGGSLTRAPYCSIPVMFSGSPWTLASPNHLYAPQSCRSTATGKTVIGRQDFPAMFQCDRTLAILAPRDADDLSRLCEAGDCIGFVGEQPPSPSAAFLRLLRREPAAASEAEPEAATTASSLFPALTPDCLRRHKRLLEPAMLSLDGDTGEVAAYVKGAFDFLCEMTLWEYDPEHIHLGV